jgi:hypothetical protein
MPADYATEGATAMSLEARFLVLLERNLKRAPTWLQWRLYECFDPAVRLLQRVAAICRAADLELDVWRVRARFREGFEKIINDAASKRVSEDVETVLGWARADGCRVEPGVDKRVTRAFLLTVAQDGKFREEQVSLQKLPIGRKAIRLRIGALNDALALYLPDIVRDEVLSATTGQPNAIYTGESIHG